jgi:hypothetical protein
MPSPARSLAPLAAVSGVSIPVLEQVESHRDTFLRAWPFKHLAIDDFFEASFAERLLAEFPRFDPELARNEMGEIAGKAVNTRIREISPAYRELYEIIGGKPFLELMSHISGIPDLILDPKMYGGGTHESRHGQELDPHVDFNYDEAQQLHRRLNVIVYLNKGWRTEWGGAIEIHSNPRDPDQNQIRAFDPIFNRCVMFETNEISWHGFPKINLPPDRRDLSRKSISIYLYTKTRPAEEIAPMHGTFYVQRPLPKRLTAGLTLTSEDVAELKDLLWRRDIWVQHYQKQELEKNRELDEKNRGILAMMKSHHAEIENAKAALATMAAEQQRLQTLAADLTRQRESLSEHATALSQAVEFQRRNIRVPLIGYAVQTGVVASVHADLWMDPRAEFEIRPVVRVRGLRLTGWRPEGSPHAVLRMRVAETAAETRVSGGTFTLDLRLPRHAREPFRVTIECDALPPMGADTREPGLRLMELRMLHPFFPLLAKII